MEEPTPPPPSKPPQASGFRRLVVMLAGIALLAIAAFLLRNTPRPVDHEPAPPPAASEAAPEDPVQRALRLAGVDSTKKNEWVDEIPGADVSQLTAAQAATFLRFANAERCSCGCGFTLAACRRFDSTCEISGPRVAALLDSVARGLAGSPAGLRERPAGAPR